MKEKRINPMLFPQRDFDLIKEGTISLVVVTILVVIAAVVYSGPMKLDTRWRAVRLHYSYEKTIHTRI